MKKTSHMKKVVFYSVSVSELSSESELDSLSSSDDDDDSSDDEEDSAESR